MLNLHEAMPNHFTENEFVNIDLDACYRQHSPHSHIKALEVIFAEGVRYADEVGDHNTAEVEAIQNHVIEIETMYESELTALRNELKVMTDKYESSLGKVPEGEVQKEVVAQVMDMGKAFK